LKRGIDIDKLLDGGYSLGDDEGVSELEKCEWDFLPDHPDDEELPDADFTVEAVRDYPGVLRIFELRWEQIDILMRFLKEVPEPISLQTLVESIAHSSRADTLLSIVIVFYRGSGKLAELFDVLLDQSAEIWDPDATFDPSFIMKRIFLTPKDIHEMIMSTSRREVLFDPSHPLAKVLDMDAYWAWRVKFFLQRKRPDFARAIYHLVKANGGVLSVNGDIRGLEASRKTVLALIKHVFEALVEARITNKLDDGEYLVVPYTTHHYHVHDLEKAWAFCSGGMPKMDRKDYRFDRDSIMFLRLLRYRRRKD